MQKYPNIFNKKQNIITMSQQGANRSLLKSSTSSKTAPVFKEYSYRFIICLIFGLVTFVNGMCWVVVTPISVPIHNAYDVPSAIVTFIPMSYLILYVFVNFPSNWVIDVKGLKKGVVAGAVLTVLGCGIRSMVKFSFYFVLVGQIFCAAGQPFIINSGMKICTRWFMPQNRSLAFAILSVMNIIGTAVGFLIPPLFVDSDSITDPALVRDQFFTLLVFQLILSAIGAILVIIFFRENPPTLPSVGAMVENTDFKESIKLLFTNKKFLGLAFAFGTVNGCFNIYGSLMDDILDPYGYTPDEVSYYGDGLMVTGIVSAGLIGAYVERTLKYRLSFLVCGIIGLLTTVAFPLGLKVLGYNFAYFMIVVILQGMVFIPLQPLSADYACDTMFPIGEAQIAGFLMTSGQIIGIIFILISQYLFGLGEGTDEQKQNSSFKTVVFCNSFLAIGCFILMFQKGELKRSTLQKQKKENDSSLISGDFSSFAESRRQSSDRRISSENKINADSAHVYHTNN